jgi:hypothetical protein
MAQELVALHYFAAEIIHQSACRHGVRFSHSHNAWRKFGSVGGDAFSHRGCVTMVDIETLTTKILGKCFDGARNE